MVTRSVFDADFNGGVYILVVSLWKARFYHKVR